MAKLSADFTEAKVYSNIPDGTVVQARVTAATLETAKESGNPMLNLTWQVIGGEYDGREIRYDYIVIGGRDKRGNPICPVRFAEFITATGMPCATGPNEPDAVHKFVVRDYMVCEETTGKPCRIYFDSDNVVGQVCAVTVGVQKARNSDKEYNTIKGYSPL